MKLTFVEAPAFSRRRDRYLDDHEYAELQAALLKNPMSGAVMRGTLGCRKLRWMHSQRGKGKRGGLRIVYCLLPEDAQLWLLTLYDKDEISDLSLHERHALGRALTAEITARKRRP